MDVVNVAVTGVSGRVGQRLLRLLDADERVERIVGLDVREPLYRPRSLEFHAVDLGRGELKPLLEGVDELVHMAFRLEPLPDERVMQQVNVEGTRRILDAASANGVGKVVLVSSGLAYGAWPNNSVPLTEDTALRPNGDFTFAVHKAEAERILSEWRSEHPGVETVVLRPPFVLGDATPAAVRSLVLGRLPFRLRDGAGEVQYLHVADLASAVAHALRHDLEGAYNVAPDGWVSADEARALSAQAPRVTLSPDAADRLAARLWRAGVADVLPGTVALLAHPVVLANDRLEATGWRPQHSSEEALLACVDEDRAPSSAGRRALVAAALGTGAAVAGGAVAWALRRRS